MFSTAVLLLFPLIGVVGGFLAGLLGIGGGIIFIPLFLWAFPGAGFPPETVVHAAFGTSLAIIIPTAVSSALAHRQRGNVEWSQVYRLAIGAFAGAVTGGWLAAGLSGEWLKGCFGLMQALVGVKLFFRPAHLPPERDMEPPLAQLLAIGFATGAFSAFFGVGGGVVAVPLMIIVLQLPTQRAVGNSSALIAVSSLFGAASYVLHGWKAPGLAPYSLGYVNLLVALLVVPCAIFSARFGVRIAWSIGDDKLLKVFAVALVAIGMRIMVGTFL